MSPLFHLCIPTRAPKPPSRGPWTHEIMHDGYRLIVRRGTATTSRYAQGAGYDWAGRYPRIGRSVLKLRVESVALDGEVVWLTENGVSDFDTLHSRTNDDWAMYLAFDILELDGNDLRDPPLVNVSVGRRHFYIVAMTVCSSSNTSKVMARRCSSRLPDGSGRDREQEGGQRLQGHADPRCGLRSRTVTTPP